MTAKDIEDLLAARHHKDVFVPQCKNGPTQYATGLQLMDAWAMRRSWTNACAFAYEIKVARSDFLADNKWRGYLAFCNQFFFVCPPGVIEPNELPAEAGLLIVSKNGKRLFAKKKAPFRAQDIPQELYQYLLMARTTVECPVFRSEWGKEDWADWLKERSIDARVGAQISRALGERIHGEVVAAQETNAQLQREVKGLKEIAEFCEQHDISPTSMWHARRVLEAKVAAAGGEQAKRNVEALQGYLERFLEHLSVPEGSMFKNVR